MMEERDSVDTALLKRLTLMRCPLRPAELADDDRLDLTEAEVLERLERLTGEGLLRETRYYEATAEGGGRVPGLHHHRPLTA